MPNGQGARMGVTSPASEAPMKLRIAVWALGILLLAGRVEAQSSMTEAQLRAAVPYSQDRKSVV